MRFPVQFRTHALAAVAFLIGLVGCSDPPVAPTAPTGSTAGSVGALAEIENQVPSMGCVFGIVDAGGGVRTITVARPALPFKLRDPRTTRRTANGGAVYLLDHASRSVMDGGITKAVGATCVMPTGQGYEGVRGALEQMSVDRTLDLIHRLERARSASLGSADLATHLASVLMQPYGTGLRSGSAVTKATARPRYAAETLNIRGLGGSPRHLMGGYIPVLPTVTAYGYAGGTWFISFASMRDWFDRTRMKSPLLWSWHLDQQQCEEANGFYDELLAGLYQQENDLNHLTQEVENFQAAHNYLTCEKPGDLPGANICLDAYIRAKIAANLMGDDRGPDPNAKFHQSRVQVYLNLDEGYGRIYPSGTTMLYPRPVGVGVGIGAQYFPPDRGQVKHAALVQISPTHMRFELDAWNAMCVQWNTRACFAIVLRVEFEKGSDGQWKVISSAGSTDFPSLDVYKDRGAGWEHIFARPEGNWWDLAPQIGAVDELRQKAYEPLPNGCYRT